jgi:hypothetical protein
VANEVSWEKGEVLLVISCIARSILLKTKRKLLNSNARVELEQCGYAIISQASIARKSSVDRL